MHPQDNINLHSEELNEVLGTPPGWLARYGILTAYLAIIVMIAVAYFVKYPDVVEANMEITVPNPSVEIVAKQTGLIEQVFVEPNEIVKTGQLMMAFATTASLADVDTLEKQLLFFSDEVFAEDINRFQPIVNLQLGAVQEEYAAFLRQYNALKYGAMSNNERNTISRKTEEINQFRNLITLEEGKITELSTRLEMAIDTKDKLQAVYSDDPKTYYKELDASAQQIKQIEADQADKSSTIERYKVSIQRLQNEIAEVRQRTGSDNQRLTFGITESIKKLKSQIRNWKNDNLIFAPIDGRVVFSQNFDNDNQTVRAGDRILEIYPIGDLGEIYAKVDLPIYNSGSVESGQEVVIKVNNYPYFTFGKLKGLVRSKADIPQENNTYKVEVDLPDGLVTSFNRELEFSQGMQGTAEIITKEKRLLFRLFDNVFADLHR